MQITTIKKKQEARKDPLIESLSAVRNYLRSHKNHVSTALVALLFLLVFVVLFRSMRQSSLEKAQTEFGKGMVAYQQQEMDRAIEHFTVVHDNYGRTPHAVYSAYLVGSLYLQSGRYTDAVTWFEEAASSNKNAGFVGAAAYEGLMNAWDAQGEREKALEYGLKALENRRLSYRRPALLWKTALLHQSLNNEERAIQACESLLSDTLAREYHQKAQNLLAELELVSHSS